MAYLRFLRFSGVFTAFADVLAGFFILRFAGYSRELVGYLPHLLAASASFYCAGMAWNDWFDIETDRRLRPERPLPAGEISLTAAYVMAIIFSAGGLMLTMAASATSFFIAAGLLLTLLVYNSGGKKIELFAPLLMGGIRGLNLTLGMSAHPDFAALLNETIIYLPPIMLGIYIAVITLLAEWEDAPNDEIIITPPTLISDPTTEIDGKKIIPTPPSDPELGYQQSELRRKRTLQIVFKQNRIARENNPPTQPYLPPLIGVRGALITLMAVIGLTLIILPHGGAAMTVGLLWLLLLAPAGITLWRLATVETLRRFVGTSLAGICLFDALLTVGFARDFFANREALGAVAVIALLTVPTVILKKYLT